MASKRAVAMLRGAALADINAAVTRISEIVGMEPPAYPATRPNEHGAALRLKALGEWMNMLADKLQASEQPDPNESYRQMTNKQLAEALLERGIDPKPYKNKDTLITALVEADAAEGG